MKYPLFLIFLYAFSGIYIRAQYAGGPDNSSSGQTLLSTPVCSVPVYTASSIYNGGIEMGNNVGQHSNAPLCSIPAYVVSNIYTGGMNSGFDMAAQLANPTCSIPVFVASNMYTGGIEDGYANATSINNATCAIPPIVVSSIYTGGIEDGSDMQAVLSVVSCAIPPIAASDIYKGGIEDGSDLYSLINVSANCNIPPFVVSDIYKGSIEDGFASAVYIGSQTPGLIIIPDGSNFCDNENIRIIAVPTAGGTNPQYEWYVNGIQQNLNNDTLFVNNPGSSLSVYATMVGNMACAGPSGTVNSNSVSLTYNPGSISNNSIIPPLSDFCIGNQSITINGNMATAPGTLSYLWEGASSNVFNIATGSNSLKDYSILQGNPYTFFRRIVSSSLCMYSDTSNIVNLNQAPALLDIFPVDNTPGSCMVYYADGWVYIPSDIDSTDLMVAVRDEENTSDLDLTQVIGYIDATEQVINGVYVLKRHFDIMPVNSSNAKVRLYFSDAELQSLMLADPSITGINDLVVQKFPTGTTTSGQIIVPDLAVSNMPFFGVHYLEISLTGFSSFYIHSSNYTALPVSWASVQASCRATGTELNWATFSEQNNAYFEIRKSADLNHWDILARVEGAGNSNSLISYSYLDAENETGIQYYQVMQVDYNGNYSHSPIAVAQCEKELMLLPAAVYPNPANHYVVFEVPSIVNGKWLYTLIDASGKTLKMESIMLEEGNNTLYESIETLMPGLYQARFNSESGQQVLLKFVKISN